MRYAPQLPLLLGARLIVVRQGGVAPSAACVLHPKFIVQCLEDELPALVVVQNVMLGHNFQLWRAAPGDEHQRR